MTTTPPGGRGGRAVMDLDALTVTDIVALQSAEEHGQYVAYPRPGSLLDQLGTALVENERLRESRDGWRDIARACQAGTITVTDDHIESWLASLRSGNDVVFGHAEAQGLADHIAVAHDVIRRYRDGWKPGKSMKVVMAGSPRPDPEPIWMSPDHRRDSEPMTPAERAVLDAAAGPDDTEEDRDA